MRNWTYARKFVFKKFWVRGKGEGGREEGVVVERESLVATPASKTLIHTLSSSTISRTTSSRTLIRTTFSITVPQFQDPSLMLKPYCDASTN